MTLNELITIATFAISLALGLGTWMFKVHAKLAVIASKLVDVADKFASLIDDHHELWMICSRHEARLERHEAEIAHVASRLRED